MTGNGRRKPSRRPRTMPIKRGSIPEVSRVNRLGSTLRTCGAAWENQAPFSLSETEPQDAEPETMVRAFSPLIGAAAYPGPACPTHGSGIKRTGSWLVHLSLLAGAMLACAGGCSSTLERFPLDPIPMEQAIGIVNANSSMIDGTLWASGHVDGRFNLPDGRSAGYHVNGVLFYLAPIYIRFDMKSLGERQFLLGSNAEHFWFYDKQADIFHCGRHDATDEFEADIPIPPEQIVDALGFTWIPEQVSPEDRTHAVQRIVDEYQQILIIERDEYGNVGLQKEYWLDRYLPRLVRRVVFRDPTGAVEMESLLDEYRAPSPGGPLLPHLMSAVWPKTGDSMRFRVNRWKLVREVGPESIQFQAPPVCDGP